MEHNLGDVLENASPDQKRILEINSQITDIFNKGFKNDEEFRDQNKQIEFLKLERQGLIDKEGGNLTPVTDQEDTAIQYKEKKQTDAERAEQIKEEISNSFEPEKNEAILPYEHKSGTNQRGEPTEVFIFNVEGGEFNIYVQERLLPEKKPSLFDKFTGFFKVKVVFKDDKPQDKMWETCCFGNDKLEKEFSDYYNIFKTKGEALKRVGEIERVARRIENEYQQQHGKTDNDEPKVETQSGLHSPDEEKENEKREKVRAALYELLNPYKEKKGELNNKMTSLIKETQNIAKEIKSNKEKIENSTASSTSKEQIKYYNITNIGNPEDLVYLTIPDSHGFFWKDKESAKPNMESFFVLNKKTGLAVPITGDISNINQLMKGDADIIIGPVIKNYNKVTSENLMRGLTTPIQLKLSEAGDKWLLIEKGETADNQNK